MSATSAGHVDVLSTLLRAGASANTPNDSGAIPLHYHKVRVCKEGGRGEGGHWGIQDLSPQLDTSFARSHQTCFVRCRPWLRGGLRPPPPPVVPLDLYGAT